MKLQQTLLNSLILWCFCAVLKWPTFSQNWTQHLWLFTFRYFDTISQGRVSLSCLPKVGAGILVCECLFSQLLFHPLSKLTHTHSDDDTAWARGYPHEGIITRFGQKTRRGEARVRRLGGKHFCFLVHRAWYIQKKQTIPKKRNLSFFLRFWTTSLR